jgi:hypothetical protein
MLRYLLAAAAAFALVAAQPVRACEDCKNCPHHKDTVAQAEKADKKADPKADDKAEKVGCHCAGGKECKCGPNCTCEHCSAHKAVKEKKGEEKKT